jgi:hypothetical protein
MERNQDKLKSFGKRCQTDTPPFFKKLRNIGLIVAAVGSSIIAAPVAIPAIVTTIGGYMILGGTVMTAVSQAAVSEEDCKE